jgi:acetyl esterase/lipase
MTAHALTEYAPLFVGGHSAGGHHASLLAVREEWWRRRGLPANPLRGCLPISGTYNFGAGSGLAIRPRFLGAGDAERAASPMIGITDHTPFFISYGEHDFPHLIIQANMMQGALQAAGTSVEVLVLPACNHFEASYLAGQAAGIWLTHASSFMMQFSG